MEWWMLMHNGWYNNGRPLSNTVDIFRFSGVSISHRDEIQKIENWSETIKALWDKDSWDGIQLKLLILGSSRLLIQHGLTESLAGRLS